MNTKILRTLKPEYGVVSGARDKLSPSNPRPPSHRGQFEALMAMAEIISSKKGPCTGNGLEWLHNGSLGSGSDHIQGAFRSFPHLGAVSEVDSHVLPSQAPRHPKTIPSMVLEPGSSSVEESVNPVSIPGPPKRPK